MDPNIPPADNPPAPGQQPSGQSPNPSLHGSSGGMKIIQPLSSDLKPEPAAPPAPAQPVVAPPEAQAPAVGVAPMATETASQPTKPNLSSFYPQATRGVSANAAQVVMTSPTEATEDIPEVMTFSQGYKIGGSIFWYQLVAGLVLSLISYVVSKFSSGPVVLAPVTIALAILDVIAYLAVLYIPYKVLKSKSIDEPLWLALFGSAAETVAALVTLAVFEIVELVVLKAVFNPSTLSSIGGVGLAVITLMLFVGLLVGGYFLTKLSWGFAFLVIGKIKNKLIVKAIGIGVIVIFVGLIGYHYLMPARSGTSSNLSSTVSTSCQSNGLCEYHVAGSPSFSVDFYKGARASTGSDGAGTLAYSTGPGVQGVSFSVTNATDSNVTSSCSSVGSNLGFNFKIQGSSGIVCVNNTNASYVGYIEVNGKNYVIYMFGYSYQQELATVQAIFNSIVIN